MKAHLLISGHPDFPTPEALETFVLAHARGGLTVRDAAMFARTMEEGLIVAILDETSDVLAMSAVLPLEQGEYEMGAALVRPDMTGFGLQRYMIAARLDAFRQRGLADWDKLYAGALQARAGDGSRAMITGSGFDPIPFDAVPKILQDECLTCTKTASKPPGERCCYGYFRACEPRMDTSKPLVSVELQNSRDDRRLTLDFASD